MHTTGALRRQRVSAYVVCVRDGHLLLSRCSAVTTSPGEWTLPGGGIDHGEHPRDAARREAYEETGLDVEVGPLLDVDSLHLTGHAPDGTLEDFHAVRLIFAGTAGGGEPRVVEVDGTTDAAAWLPLADLRAGRLPVVPLVTAAIETIEPVG